MKFELKTIGNRSYFHVPEMSESGIIHGFMTRSSDSILHDRDQEKEFSSALSATDVVILNQEHGDVVHVIGKGFNSKSGDSLTGGDGLILLEKGVIGVIKTADCIPIILCDPDQSRAAIVHAGWRGTAARITQTALMKLKDMGSDIGTMTALIGPGIGPCCYSVGDEVMEQFLIAGFHDHIFQRRGTSLYLNLKMANRDALSAEGIGTICDIDLCTSCRQDLFASARKGAKLTRQVNFVMVKS
jgi:polyphenol oxidase